MVIKTYINREDYKPISEYKDGYRVLWNYTPAKKAILDEEGHPTDQFEDDPDHGICSEFIFKYKPSVGLVKNIILEDMNKEIDQKILNGFTWDDKVVWLSSENQFNYKAAYDLAVQTSGQNLPLIMKFGTTNEPEYVQFDDMETLTAFYMSAMQHIQQTLAEGWQKKDSIDWNEYDYENSKSE